MHWHLSNRCDPRARPLADRHYPRQKVGAKGFVAPGRCLVLLTTHAEALWVTSWPFAQFVKHAWGGAWICSSFRNEGVFGILSSELILQAVAATRWRYPEVPQLGMITFIDRDKVRKKRDPGRCFLKAGFIPCGFTKGGKIALQLMTERMPEPCKPRIMLHSHREDAQGCHGSTGMKSLPEKDL